MQFLDNSLTVELAARIKSTSLHDRACAHNLLFEERVSASRRAFFETHVSSAPVSPERLRNRCTDYYREYVRTSGPIPHTFTSINSDAVRGNLSPEQKILRVEGIQHLLDQIGITFEQLQTALLKSDGPSNTLVRYFLREWNTRPDIRRNPIAFITFKDEFHTDLAADNWPDRLVDRLGLPHFIPTSIKPVPIALMEYEVSDVLEQSKSTLGLNHAFCIPTVLDSDGQNYQFFPTPREMGCGCPMSLQAINDYEDLVVEFLHLRINYRLEHLNRVGKISAMLQPEDLKNQRNNQLMALRIAAIRDDFGDEI